MILVVRHGEAGRGWRVVLGDGGLDELSRHVHVMSAAVDLAHVQPVLIVLT